MTKKRMGDAWMPAADYGRAMPKFSLNLLVHEVERSLPFYKEILGAIVRYADQDFAALNLQGVDFMLHSDHTYDHHPDRKSTRLNSSHDQISYAVFCLKKKKK